MDRTATLSYLQDEYAEIADDSQLSATATTRAYSRAIDMALRALGAEETALTTTTVGQSQIAPYFALLRYYVLRRFNDILAVRVDTNINGTLSMSRSQAAKAMSGLVAEAAQECAALGYPVDASGRAQQMTSGSFSLDIFEPSVPEDYYAL